MIKTNLSINSSASVSSTGAGVGSVYFIYLY